MWAGKIIGEKAVGHVRHRFASLNYYGRYGADYNIRSAERQAIADFGFWIADWRTACNPQSAIQNPKSKIQNPKSKIQNPKSKIN
jgi:hypothetical protein